MRNLILPLLLLTACSTGTEPRRTARPEDWTSSAALSNYGPVHAIRVSYFNPAAKIPYMTFTSHTWAERQGNGAWEPFGAYASAARGDGVNDDHMHRLVEGLRQVGLDGFPPVDFISLDAEALRGKSFKGCVVTVQTEEGRSAYLVRNALTGAAAGSPEAAKKVDLIFHAFGSAYSFNLDAGVDSRKR